MNSRFSIPFGLSAALVLASAAAVAQTTTPATPGQAPAAVGVTPQTATDANRQAVPRSDTGSVVRTGPTAGERAGAAADSAAATTSNAVGATGAAASAAITGNTGNTGASTTTMGASGRSMRADRN